MVCMYPREGFRGYKFRERNKYMKRFSNDKVEDDFIKPR